MWRNIALLSWIGIIIYFFPNFIYFLLGSVFLSLVIYNIFLKFDDDDYEKFFED